MSHVDPTCGHILIPIHQLAGGRFPLIKGFLLVKRNIKENVILWLLHS